MKIILISCIISLALLSQKSLAQTAPISVHPTPESHEMRSEDYIYDSLEKSAEYPGGINKFREYVVNNFNYPEELAESIRFTVTFTVEKDGSLTNIQLSNNPGFGIAEQIQKIFATSKKWTPGQEHNKAVRSRFRFPLAIQFE